MYASHIPTSTLQKVLLAGGSAAMAILRPMRGDMVATMGETTAVCALPRIRARMQAHEVGSQLLSEMPRVTDATVDRAYLAALPSGTFGREYERFLARLSTSPDERPPVQFVDDADNVYVMQRYRESHDFYHTVLEMPTSMLGEVAVKWFEGIQLGLPMCVLGGLFGAARLRPKQRQLYVDEYLPWAVRNARNAEFFMNVYWERHWEKTLDELQRFLRLETPPTRKTKHS